MDTMPLAPRHCLAAHPLMPPQTINDDDLYVVDVRTNVVITRYSASSDAARIARIARVAGLQVKPGQALLKGMQLRSMGAMQ